MNNETAVACKSAHSRASPQTDSMVQPRRGVEKPHPLLTYFVCGLMAVGRNSGLEWVETCRDFSPLASLAYIFIDCVDDLAVDFRQRRVCPVVHSYHYIN